MLNIKSVISRRYISASSVLRFNKEEHRISNYLYKRPTITPKEVKNNVGNSRKFKTNNKNLSETSKEQLHIQKFINDPDINSMLRKNFPVNTYLKQYTMVNQFWKYGAAILAMDIVSFAMPNVHSFSVVLSSLIVAAAIGWVQYFRYYKRTIANICVKGLETARLMAKDESSIDTTATSRVLKAFDANEGNIAFTFGLVSKDCSKNIEVYPIPCSTINVYHEDYGSVTMYVYNAILLIHDHISAYVVIVACGDKEYLISMVVFPVISNQSFTINT